MRRHTIDRRVVEIGVGNLCTNEPASLGRESLYKALSPAGNPEFATILKVVAALGLQLQATQASVKGAV